MTQEEIQLLLIDLCARLPYGVKIHIDFNWNGHIVGDATLNTITSITRQIFNFVDFEQDFKNGDCCPISGFGSNKHLHLGEFKPYLRSMSSMTEEEKRDILQSLNIHGDIDNEGNLLLGTECNIITLKVCKKYLGELNKRMFDVCHMIEKGLALEAPEGMYKTE